MPAARRSGLYYTVVSTHLTPPEVAYIIDNSGAQPSYKVEVLKL